MPLVVPGITGTSGDKTEEWTNKLVGKKLSDGSSSETVSVPAHISFRALDSTSGAMHSWAISVPIQRQH
jgi:hypothetical protein